MGVSSLSQSEILRAIEWYDELGSIDSKIQGLSLIAFEFQVIVCIVFVVALVLLSSIDPQVNPYQRSPFGGINEVAWPRPIDMKHLLLIIINGPKDSSAEQDNLTKQLLIDAPKQILGDRANEGQVNPAGLELDYHDPKRTYGQHYEKLIKLRKLYDPKQRFKGLVNP